MTAGAVPGTVLIRAFIHGYAIWTEGAAINVFVGAIPIVAASLVPVSRERRNMRIAERIS